MYVLGTAGHVDHGKSALVQAITNIDPDRLAEEKIRGLTIELGFAWLSLPGGKEVSIVDVPGHERFIKNMLAGVGGIDIALMVIAADEGVMPQTREHLAILDILQISQGIIVVTKKDLVDEEMIQLVTMDIEDTVKGTFLEEAPVIVTSALTGSGLDELIAAIDSILESAPPRRDIGRPRMAVDRVFTMKGFGTVVTGTLVEGQFSVGQQVEVLPIGRRAGIRGLQTHQKKLETAVPGTRVAMNLSGVAVEDIARGCVITTPGWLKPSRYLDVKLNAIRGLARPISHNKNITFYSGAAEATGKVRLLDREKLGGGESGWAQIVLSRPAAVARGDFFIIRSAVDTLGGGTIVETGARRHRRFQENIIENLRSREKGTPEDVLLATIEAAEPIEYKNLSATCSFSRQELDNVLSSLSEDNRVVMIGEQLSQSLVFTYNGWNRYVERIKGVLGNYHTQFPLRHGMPKEELRSRLEMQTARFSDIIRRLTQEKAIAEDKAHIKLVEHVISLTPEQRKTADAFMESLSSNPYSPPVSSLPDTELLNMLIEAGKVVKVSENIVFSAGAYEQMINTIVEHLKTNGSITVADVRDMFKTSRKYALALMEHLDQIKVTRRVGDERVLR
ncbi:MAG: selenocysteine-specific translation elongation factor [Dehalococcoidia bacterium]